MNNKLNKKKEYSYNCSGRGGGHVIYECGIGVSQNESFYI